MNKGLAVWVSAIVLGCRAVAADFYVSPGGNDGNDGAIGAPFATLEKARTEVRSLKAGGLPPGGVTVWLRGGTHTRTNTFDLTAADAGAPWAPVTYRGYPGEEARVSGGTKLDPSWFYVVSNTSPVWSRIDTNARGFVMQADLGAHGITNYGTLRPRGFYGTQVGALELFFTNAPMPLARWPDPDEHEADLSYTNSTLQMFGNPSPDVTGTYVANGTNDGVNKYQRSGLVGTNQYNLYRHSWVYNSNNYTAWFLTTQASGYPGSADPWWYRYSQELGDMSAATQSLSSGSVNFRVEGKITHGWADIGTAISSNSFAYTGTRPERWTQAEEPWFHGFWMWHWADNHVKASSITTNTKTVVLATPPTYGITAGQPYYAENLLEEITRPGEWYLNRSTGILYFWPPSSLAGTDIHVSLIEQPLMRIKDTTNIVVRDITFELSRSELVNIENGMCNGVFHCTMRNCANYASKVTGVSNGVSSCVIENPGDGGVRIGGGNRPLLVPGRNYVRNCEIRNFSRWSWTYQPAALIESETVGQLVSHNNMHGSPHTAMLFGRGNNHTIEFNHIHDVCIWSSDAGAVYIGRDWGARGNAIQYNFIHDVASLFAGTGMQGVYLDDCQSGVKVFGNVIYKVANGGIQMGGGRDNIMENNVIVKCGQGILGDSRGTGWMYANGGSSNLWQNLQGYPYQGVLWSNAYPLCAAIPNNWTAVTNGTWFRPEGCIFSRNIGYSNGTWMSTGDNAFYYFKEITNNIGNTNLLFVDEANLDMTLQSNSPAYTIPGFEPIPFRQIGLESNKTLSVQVWGGGSATAVPAQSDYYPMQFAWLSASASNMWYFYSWTGAVVAATNGVSVWVTNDTAVTAVFKPYVVTNGTPIWWLASHGLATNDAGALADNDGDKCYNWQEYIAGTDPTNSNSRFEIRSVTGGTAGVTVSFSAAGNRSYDIEYREALLDTNGWMFLTNKATTADAILEIVDPSQAAQRYYRLKARVL